MKILLTIIGIVVIILCCAGFIVGNRLYNFALVPGAERSALLEADHNQIPSSRSPETSPAISDSDWLETTGYTELDITSERDQTALHAYEIRQTQPAEKWVVIAHGYTSNALNMAGSARQFYGMGYNVLMPDARGHGKSGGAYIGMGWHDRLDLLQWVNRIIRAEPRSQIVLYGISMGGATVMMASGEALPENIKVIIEDCGYSSVNDEFAYQLTELFGLPRFPFLNFASLVTKIRAGYFLGEANAVTQVAKSKTPMMFIHGTKDTFVPYEMVYKVYEAAQVEKKLLIVEDAAHASSSSVLGAQYWDEVEGFIGQFMP